MKLSKGAKAKRNEYMKNWRQNNKEKVKQHNKTYWEKQARESKEEATS